MCEIEYQDYRDCFEYKIGRFILVIEGLTPATQWGQAVSEKDIEAIKHAPIGVLLGKRERHGRFLRKRRIFLGHFKMEGLSNHFEFHFFGVENRSLVKNFCRRLSILWGIKVVYKLVDKNVRYETFSLL